MFSKKDEAPDLFGFKKSEMDPLAKTTSSYMQELKRRNEESHAYKSYQLTGLEIANILEDWDHKSLYIKLAQKHGESKMRELAKSIAEKKNIENKGAYFMSVLKSEKQGLPKKFNGKNSNYRN